MTVTYLQEMAKSRDAVIDLRAGSSAFELMALVFPPYDLSDDQDVIAAVRAYLSPRYGYQQLRTINVKSLGGPAWQATATYGFDEGDSVETPAGDPLPYEFSFDTTGGTVHITQALETRASGRYGPPVSQRTVDDLVTVGPRTITDAVTTLGSATLTSATAAFTSADVGAVLTSTTANMLPVTCTIKAVNSGTSVSLSSAALANTTGGNLTISGVVLTSATAAFVAPTPGGNPGDVGASVSSTTPGVLPAGATISVVLSATQAQIRGGTILSTQAAANLTIGARAAVNFNRAIGVSREGVAGTDVTAPKLEFQMIRNFQGMTLSYIRDCHKLTGTTNDSVFYGYERGPAAVPGRERHAVAEQPGRRPRPLCARDVPLRRIGQRHRVDLDLVPDDASGNHLLRVDKKGWEYLWVYYKDDVDAASNTMRPRPDAFYVEKVYEDGDFRRLLIGVE
jgi:hypothetical protein